MMLIRKSLLLALLLAVSGCGAAHVKLTRPDGVQFEASAVALFRDTGLEGFNYEVDEKTKGAGMLAATASRAAKVGAKGYTGTTKAETLIKLLEAIPD